MPDETEGFTVRDRRASTRTASNPGSGLVTGMSVESAKRLASQDALQALSAGKRGVVPTDPEMAREMRVSRLKNGKVASAFGNGGFGGISFATQRPKDPFWYWQQNNLPYDFTKPDQLEMLRALCRHIYKAHPVMASAIDIFSRWPLIGMEMVSKDSQIAEFYTELFFEGDLNYEDYLPKVLREYYLVGEAFPLGSFNETLGVWDADELINPDDVFVEKSPFIKEPHMFIRLPESLRRILTTGTPIDQYNVLMRSYPELKAFAQENARMPVSNVLLKHLKFDVDTFAVRGLPIMYRALRSIMQEEMLNAAQDAIADRLYTPLILAKIGASATDLGTQEPWIPTEGQISSFEAALDAALAADFRVLTTHFAVDMSSVFGRETMPNFDADFDRLTEKQLQAFGLSKTMLSGSDQGETYAADALNRDLVSQLLRDAQRYIKRFVEDRMRVVAEAQEHYDYEVRGGKRYPIMEEVLEVDEETGEQRIVEQPKLLIPTFQVATMNIKDDEQERAFLEALSASGVPISQKRRLVNIPIDLEEEIEQVFEEQVEQAVEAQRVRRELYKRLKAERLPIPDDLKQDFEAKASTPGEADEGAAIPTREPTIGLDGQDTSALAPTPDQQMLPPGEPLGVPAGPGGTISDPSVDPATLQGAPSNVIPLPTNRIMSRPPESDEQRKRMPKPGILKNAYGDEMFQAETGPDGEPLPYMEADGNHNGSLVSGPRHIGARRYSGLSKDVPLDDEDE